MRLHRHTTWSDNPDDAFSGEGARRSGGRWNPKGTAVVYTSTSIALALVEQLVGMEAEDFALLTVRFTIDLEPAQVETPDLAALPTDWNHPRRSDRARAFGRDWVESNRSLALAVPSVVVPEERNVLLNPGHPDFPTLPFSGPLPFRFDKRLLKAPPPPTGLRKPRRR